MVAKYGFTAASFVSDCFGIKIKQGIYDACKFSVLAQICKGSCWRGFCMVCVCEEFEFLLKPITLKA